MDNCEKIIALVGIGMTEDEAEYLVKKEHLTEHDVLLTKEERETLRRLRKQRDSLVSLQKN